MACAEGFPTNILDDLYSRLLTLSAGGQQLAGPPGGGRAGAAVSPSGWGVRAPPRSQVRWLCLGARSCRRLITAGGCRAGWLVALPGWWPVRSGLGRWSWPHTVRYRLPRRAWSCDPVSWMGGGETDADRQHCLWADSAVFDGEDVQLCADPVQCGGRLRDGLFGQQDEEFLSAVAVDSVAFTNVLGEGGSHGA